MSEDEPKQNLSMATMLHSSQNTANAAACGYSTAGRSPPPLSLILLLSLLHCSARLTEAQERLGSRVVLLGHLRHLLVHSESQEAQREGENEAGHACTLGAEAASIVDVA